MQQSLRSRPSLAVLATALLALAACNQNGGSSQTAANGAAPPALPLTTGAATAPTLAPSASALPAAPRPKIVRVASQADQYAYVDQAQAMAGALGSAPPDYAFDYDGARPWVWQASDNSTRFVEPVSGGYRYYYYRPGSDYPYYVQDPQYGYGFNDGQLVAVYDARGAILPPQYVDERADYAGRYLARARALYDASRRAQRQSVIAANWAARRAQIDEQQAEWARERVQDAAWQSYHQQHDAELQNYWQSERDHRYASAQAFDQWHNQGYQGPPPPPAYGPAALAGAAVAGGVVGALIAGHHDHGGPPPPAAGPGPAPGGAVSTAAPTFAGGRPSGANAPDPRAAEQAQRQQGQDAQRAAVAQQQAQAAATARQQALAQGDQGRAAEEAARQAQAQQQARQAEAGRQAAAEQQARAAVHAQVQPHQPAQAQGLGQVLTQTQIRQQQSDQAVARRLADAAARNQAQATAEQAAVQAAAQRQAQQAARAQAQAQALQARQQQAARSASAAAAQHQAQSQAVEAAAQHQAQAQAAAAHAQAAQAAQAAAHAQAAQAAAHAQAAQAAQAAAHANHPPGGPHPGEAPRPGEPGHPQP